MGYPHRLKALEQALRYIIDNADEWVWFATASAINDYYRQIENLK